MKDNSCTAYFNKLKSSSETKKLVVLLGSGFHKNDFCKKSILSDWNLLLNTISPNINSSGDYLLDFEKIILEQVSDSNAQTQENVLLKFIGSQLKDAQKNALENEINNYPSFIFNPNYVSDVISLNFDCVAEKLCLILFKAKLVKSGYVKIDEKLGDRSLIHQTTKYRTLRFPEGRTITFWYPHGSLLNSTNMILGARKYGQHINCIESLRKHSKAEARKNQKNDTWYDKLTHNPLLILGSSISSNEWDIWSAIVNRERNFFKMENNKYRNPIFQMRSQNFKCDCKDISNQKWFEPLFDETLSYKDQWDKLKTLFKN
jgi:predicted metallopeptidase